MHQQDSYFFFFCAFAFLQTIWGQLPLTRFLFIYYSSSNYFLKNVFLKCISSLKHIITIINVLSVDEIIIFILLNSCKYSVGLHYSLNIIHWKLIVLAFLNIYIYVYWKIHFFLGCYIICNSEFSDVSAALLKTTYYNQLMCITEDQLNPTTKQQKPKIHQDIFIQEKSPKLVIPLITIVPNYFISKISTS